MRGDVYSGFYKVQKITYPSTFPKSPIVVPSQISGTPSDFHPVETFGNDYANIGGAKAIQNRYNDTLKYC